MGVHRADNGAGSIEAHGPSYRWRIKRAGLLWSAGVFETRREAAADLNAFRALLNAGTPEKHGGIHVRRYAPEPRQLSLAAA